MNDFIDPLLIEEMRAFKPYKIINKNGNPNFTKKAFMLGKNTAILSKVSARRSEYGKPLFDLTFTRGSAIYADKKIDFAPMTFTLPYPDNKLVEICALCGDSLLLPVLPDRDYLNGLYQTLKSYQGKEFNVYIRQKKILSRDKYGRPQVDDNPMQRSVEPIIITVFEIASFKEPFDWALAILPLSEEDQKDLDLMTKVLKA